MLFDSICVGGNRYNILSNCKKLGVFTDEELTIKNHVAHTCNSCYMYLINIRLIRPFLTVLAAKVISSSMDFCNSLLIGILGYSIKKLQNTVAHIPKQPKSKLKTMDCSFTICFCTVLTSML